ncbi:MAG: electron transfer flavoprotein subunit beta/FixA family protein [Pseudomonadota bacterium]|jgi:electron transfer flavoprotein beta subunit|nr:electron transfer flavoprotein subunit beta/FixA family protein [SAR86 cluster bacterium]MEC8108629.1 electron transfer flavoprotein subunit beta/FixA family protein [Pseudomonadota bacterium]MEC8169245.1 electron transfer flavoprotein subunit beta/FixA family protein [Pseudomonadota bacterium]MEC8378367.1 electron transfer flavoprotein subunit beta/FixA family protein [Pseudomonadota bacterium]MEC9192971.1 electron transfer flavoprotein subunit beta/FixA family protein [Pseudomonadota bacte|tara:strand:- start:657 stop:1409 length:753 start_codon:yes stop_codon:yes gene_type:complete
MKILIPIKRVVDYNVKVRPMADESGVDLNNVKMAINPFCEIAVEEAVRLKESGVAEEIISVTIGSTAAQEQLRTSLALGADRAILIETDSEVEPLGVAKLLKAVVEKENPDLIIMGKQAIDGDNNQTGQKLAALLGYPQATFASELSINDGKAEVTREIDGGLQTVSVNLPAIVTTDLRLNEPRYASLPNIMKAKSKPLDVMQASDLGVDISPRISTLKVTLPPEREAGVIVETVDELVDKLKNEAKVIS